MSIEHNPNPLTDEEWERMPRPHAMHEPDRRYLDALRANGVTVEPPPAPRYSVSKHFTGLGYPKFRVDDNAIAVGVADPNAAEFRDEDDARTWCDVLNGKAKIVYGGDA